MKTMLLIFLIPLSVYGKSDSEQYSLDLDKSGCRHIYWKSYSENLNQCGVASVLYRATNVNCAKGATRHATFKEKECVKEYQDRSWWKKLF